jgi:hypothetical protein
MLCGQEKAIGEPNGTYAIGTVLQTRLYIVANRRIRSGGNSEEYTEQTWEVGVA